MCLEIQAAEFWNFSQITYYERLKNLLYILLNHQIYKFLSVRMMTLESYENLIRMDIIKMYIYYFLFLVIQGMFDERLWLYHEIFCLLFIIFRVDFMLQKLEIPEVGININSEVGSTLLVAEKNF